MFAVATALVIVLASHSARADDEQAAAEAMRRGVAAYAQGDATAALAAYEEAKRLAPAANVPFLYAAEALLHLQRYPEAVASLEQYLAKNPGVSDAADVKARIAQLRREQFPGHIRIESSVPATRVTIDGAPRAEALPSIIDLPPGKHTVVWVSDGYRSESRDIVVVGDTQSTEGATLTANPPPPPPDPPRTHDEGAKQTPLVRTIGFVAAGAGSATLATAFVLDLTALKQKTDDFNRARNAGDPSAVGLQGDARGLRTGVAATYIVGGVLAAGGITLVLLSPRNGAAVSLTPQAIFLRGHF